MYIFNNAPIIRCIAGHRAGFADVLIMCKLYNYLYNMKEYLEDIDIYNSPKHYSLYGTITLNGEESFLTTTISGLIRSFLLNRLKCIELKPNEENKTKDCYNSFLDQFKNIVNTTKICCGLFIEGTFHNEKNLLDFKEGAFRISQDTGTELVALLIKYNNVKFEDDNEIEIIPYDKYKIILYNKSIRVKKQIMKKKIEK